MTPTIPVVRLVLCWFVMVCLVEPLQAQSPFFRSDNNIGPVASFFSVKDGLPSNQVFDLAFDREGRLWICTDNGLVIFDGTSFETVDLKDNSSVVLGVKKDRFGRLWFWTIRNEILIWNDSLQEIQSQISQAQMDQVEGVVTDMEIRDSNVVLMNGNIAYHLKRTEQLQTVRIERSIPGKFEIHQKDYLYAYLTKKDTDGYAQINYSNEEGLIVRDSLYLKVGPGYALNILENEHTSYVSLFSNVIRIDKETGEMQFGEIPILSTPSLTLIGDTSLWIGSRSGLFELDAENLKIKQNILTDYGVSSITEDSRGGIWVGTLESGVGYIPDLSNISIDFGDQNHWVEYFATNGNDLVLSTQSGKLYGVKEIEGDIQVYTKIGEQGKSAAMIFKYGNKIIVEQTISSFFEIPYNESEIRIYPAPYNSIFHRNLRFIRKKGVIYFLDAENEAFIPVSNVPSNLFRLSRNFAFESGIYCSDYRYTYFYDEEQNAFENMLPNSRYDLRSALKYSVDTILLGTKGDGLLLAKGNKIVGQPELDRPIKTILDMVQVDEDIWLITTRELIRLRKKGHQSYSVSVLNKILGIGQEPMQRLFLWKNRLVLCTSNQIYLLNPGNRSLKVRPLHVNHLEVRSDSTYWQDPKDKIVLNHDFPGLTITPKTVSLSGHLGVNWRYRISTVNTSWSYTSSLPIIVHSLPVGQHEIELQVQGPLGHWSVNDYSVLIEVVSPIWRRWWFITLMILLIALLVGVYMRNRIAQINHVNELEMNVIRSRNQALGLQLNPHFLYNSLNSVIASIAQNDTLVALRYLSRFSRLMRSVFEHSNEHFVPLQKELELINRYLELEKLRLREALIYSVELDEGLKNKVCYIPPMILQPLIENAIWHGIVPLQGEGGTVEIKVKSESNNRIKVTILDSGLGNKVLSAASKVSKNRQGSLSLIERRLTLLNQIYGEVFFFRLEYPAEGGCLVTLIIPDNIR